MVDSEVHARVEEADGVLTVTFDRQGKLNAISPAMTATLADAVRALRERADLRVLVIQAVGKYFTAGYDIADFVDEDVPPSAYRWNYIETQHRLYDALEELDKPVVVAVHGTCLGAGVELAGSCDFRLAAERSTFALPELNLSVIPGSGGTSRITRLLGVHWAKWLVMANQTVSAERALAMGLVHDVYPDEGFHARVHDFAVGLTRLPREALGLAKIAINMCANTDPATARDVERLVNNVLVQGAEYKGLVTEFKRRSGGRG